MYAKQCRIGKFPAYRVLVFHFLLILLFLLFLPTRFTLVSLSTSSAYAADASSKCAETYPRTAVITVGSSQSEPVNNAMLLKFIGHITNNGSLVNGVRSTVRICANTTVAYSVLAANVDTDPYTKARCFIDGRRVENSGILRIGERFVCHDPSSGDSDRIRITQEF